MDAKLPADPLSEYKPSHIEHFFVFFFVAVVAFVVLLTTVPALGTAFRRVLGLHS